MIFSILTIGFGLFSIFIATLAYDWFLFSAFLLLGIAAVVLGGFEIWQILGTR